jgi:hypothetical protein
MVTTETLNKATIGVLIAFVVVFILSEVVAKRDPNRGVPVFNQPRILFGIGSIIGTSMCMMWAEVLMLRYIILPGAHAQILNLARCTGIELDSVDSVFGFESGDASKKNQLGLLPGEILAQSGTESDATLYTLSQAEEEKVVKINRYAYFSMLYIFFFLGFIIFLIHLRLHRLSKGSNIHAWAHTRAVFLGGILSVGLFGWFQYWFYMFAIRYKYFTPTIIAQNTSDFIREEIGCKGPDLVEG